MVIRVGSSPILHTKNTTYCSFIFLENTLCCVLFLQKTDFLGKIWGKLLFYLRGFLVKSPFFLFHKLYTSFSACFCWCSIEKCVYTLAVIFPKECPVHIATNSLSIPHSLALVVKVCLKSFSV